MSNQERGLMGIEFPPMGNPPVEGVEPRRQPPSGDEVDLEQLPGEDGTADEGDEVDSNERNAERNI